MHRGWLCLAPNVCLVGDALLTLLGQSTAYWTGDHAAVREANPLARQVLEQGPGYFIIGIALWSAVVTALLLLWRNSLCRVVAFLVTLLHAVGMATWLVRHGLPGMLAALAVLVLAERLLSWTWTRNGK